MLEYKAKLHGRTFAKTGRLGPPSQVCSACGVKDGPKPLAVREWTCGACGTVLDRDVNAALNIKRLGQVAAGRAETENACGGQVRPAETLAPASEAGSRRSAA
jgi:putative transposase